MEQQIGFDGCSLELPLPPYRNGAVPEGLQAQRLPWAESFAELRLGLDLHGGKMPSTHCC